MFPTRPRLVLACAALLLTAGCGLVAPNATESPSATTSRTYPHLQTSEGKDTSRGHNDPRGLWAAVDLAWDQEFPEDPGVLLDQQRAWARAIESDFPPGGDITCDPRTFLPLRHSYLINVAVTGPDPSKLTSPDQALLREALSRAGARIMLVTGDGRELTEQQYEAQVDNGESEDDYTPNYVSEPEGYTSVVGISNIDTKGERYTWLERTALRIVAEELRRAGALPARIVPYLDIDTQAWLREQGEQLPSEKELR